MLDRSHTVPQLLPRWCHIVRYQDHISGVWCERRFLGENGARAYARLMREQGFWFVTVRAVRPRYHQPWESHYQLADNSLTNWRR